MKEHTIRLTEEDSSTYNLEAKTGQSVVRVFRSSTMRQVKTTLDGFLDTVDSNRM